MAEASVGARKEDTSNRTGKKVTPGKVRWHQDFAAAVEESRSSGKPVLLFQLLGQLDDEFT